MTCEQIKQLIENYPETGPGEWSAEEISAHIAECDKCARAAKIHQAYSSAVEGHFEELRSASGGLKDKVLQELQAAPADTTPVSGISWDAIAAILASLDALNHRVNEISIFLEWFWRYFYVSDGNCIIRPDVGGHIYNIGDIATVDDESIGLSYGLLFQF